MYGDSNLPTVDVIKPLVVILDGGSNLSNLPTVAVTYIYLHTAW